MSCPSFSTGFALVLCAAVCMGCSMHTVSVPVGAPFEVPADLGVVPVMKLGPGTAGAPAGGSAVMVADRLWLSCQHCVGLEHGAVELEGVRRLALPVDHGEEISGVPGQMELADDWIAFTLPDEQRFRPSPSLAIDFAAPIDAGEEVVVIGFWTKGQETIDAAAYRALVRSEVPMRVVRPALAPFSPRLLYLEPPDPDAEYRGLSGGAVVRWDEARRAWVLLGIMQGQLDHRRTVGPFSWRIERVCVVVRPDISLEEAIRLAAVVREAVQKARGSTSAK